MLRQPLRDGWNRFHSETTIPHQRQWRGSRDVTFIVTNGRAEYAFSLQPGATIELRP